MIFLGSAGMRAVDSRNKTRYSTGQLCGHLRSLVLAVAACVFAVSASGQVPSVVFTAANGVTGICSSAAQASCDYGGTASHIAANSRGDVFITVSANSSYVMEQPVNGGPQVALITGLGGSYGGHSIYVDSSNNVWVPDTGDAQILFIPFVNGSYPTNVAHSGMANCSAFPVPATQTTSCVVPLGYPGNLGYYVQVGDMGIDAAGNLYLLDKYTGGNFYGGVDVLIQVSAATGAFTLLSTTLQNDASAQIAVSSAGDVFVVDYGSVTYFPAGHYSSPVGVPNLNGPNGVSMDASGNVFITNNSANNIIEIPRVAGSYNVGTQFVVANKLSTAYTSNASQGVAIDGFGKITYAGSYPNSLSALTVGSLSFGNTALTTSSGALTLNLAFNASVNFGTFSIVGPTGAFAVSTTTCAKANAYLIGGACSASVVYTATAVGPQTAQLLAFDNSGNLLGHATLSGNGTGPQLTVDPGTVSSIGSGWTAPGAIAIDPVGNLYVADASTGSIYKTTAGGSTKTTVATGFNGPTAVAVDAGGNLYVGDAGNAQIVEVPYATATSTYGSKIVLLTGLKGASGLALDNVGNLYVADSGNARVLRLASSGGQAVGSLVTVFGSGYTAPVAVAVDSGGAKVYVADSGQVIQTGILTGTNVTVLSGLTTAAGLAVDAGGSLFAVDSGAKTIVRLPNIGGALNANYKLTVGTIVTAPKGIAADASGSLYVTDPTNSAVGTMVRSTGALNFGTVNVLTPSSTVAATISDSGTSALTFASPYYVAAGNTSSFTVQSSSTCASGATIQPGAQCTVAAIFTPQAPGALSDTLSFTGTSGKLVLSGSGAQLAKTNLTVVQTSPTGTPSFGQPVVITATVAPQTGTGTPTGTVTFYLDTVAQTPVSLSGTSATFTFSTLTGGVHSITASYSGDSTFAYSSANTLTLTIAKASTAISTVALSSVFTNSTPVSQAPGVAVTFTATGLPAKATGTVSFYSGTNLLASGTVIAGAATASTSTLAVGLYNVTASYSGDANYIGSSSPAGVALLISNPTISMTTTATTIIGGGPAITLNFTSVSGFNDTADLSCAGLPKYAACAFAPAYVKVSSTQPGQVALSVVINQPPVIAVPGSMGGLGAGQGSGRAGIVLSMLLLLPSALAGFWLRGRRRRSARFAGFALTLLLLLGASVSGLSGCGGTSTASYATPKGTTALTVNATISIPNPTGPGYIPNPPPAQSLQLQLIVN
jgi:sugar lactone lactonase YvrE